MQDNLQNTFMRNYLQYVKDSAESPEIFHVWSALACAGAASVRRTWLDLGSVRHYPNQYVMLIGPSSSRKSTAMKIMKKLFTTYSYLKLAPTDTAGARQGLLAALRGEVTYGDSDQALSAEFSEQALMDTDMGAVDEEVSELFVFAPQLSSFLGQKQFDLIQCLSFCYKNPPQYSYRLKTTQEYVSKPTLSILGAAASENLYACLPANASGLQFISKCMLVFSVKGKKSMPRPKPLSKQFADDYLKAGIVFCRQHTGGMKETPEAASALDALYDYEVSISDSRFIDYAAIRSTHLCKAIIALALLDGRDTITKADVEDAHYILCETEETMPYALGEYGLNPVSVAKQRIIEIVNSVGLDKFISDVEIFNLINRDVSQPDFNRAIAELHATEKIVRLETKTADGTRTVYRYTAIDKLSNTEKEKILNQKNLNAAIDDSLIADNKYLKEM